MSVVRTKYIGAELQYDGLEEVKVRVDKKCRCDCRVKEEVLNTHISSNNYPRRWFFFYIFNLIGLSCRSAVLGT